MEALQKAIDGLKREMFDYQAVQEQLKDKDIVAQKKEQYANQIAEEERKALVKKEQIASSRKRELETELKDAKV